MPSNQPAAGMLAVKPEYLSSQPSPMAKVSEPNRNKSYDPKKQHITDTPITKANWYKHVNWLNVTLIVGIPLYGVVQAWWVPLYWKTAIFAVAYYFMSGLGITAGESCCVAGFLCCTDHHCRLSSSVGTHFLFSNVAASNLPRCGRWGGSGGLSKMVGQGSSSTSSLHRHR